MKKEQNIYNELMLQSFIGDIRSEFKACGFLRAMYSTDKPRTLSQNSLIYSLYGRISREGGQESADEVRARCKLTIGVPILRSEDAEYCDTYDAVIKPLTYEQKIKAMAYWPCTQLMNTDQLSRYHDEIVRREIPEARAVA